MRYAGKSESTRVRKRRRSEKNGSRFWWAGLVVQTSIVGRVEGTVGDIVGGVRVMWYDR